MRLTAFEQALLAAVLEGEDACAFVDLHAFEVEERSYSGCGVTTTLRPTDGSLLFAPGVSLRLGGKTGAVINGSEPIGVLVYVDDGRVTALEAFTFGGIDWPAEIREFTIERLSRVS